MKYVPELSDDIVTLGAITGVVLLGLYGVTDTTTIAAIAGLGGYKLRQSRNKQ